MLKLFILCIVSSALICDGFHWSTYTRLMPHHQRCRTAVLAKPSIGDVVNAKIDKVFTAIDPHASLSIKNDGELFKARITTTDLSPSEKKILQVGSEIKVVVANNRGPKLEVRLPAGDTKNTDNVGPSDQQLFQFRCQFKLLSKDGKTVLVSDFIASPEMQTQMEEDNLNADIIDELLLSLGLTKSAALTEDQFIGLNQIFQEFAKMSAEPFSEDEISHATEYVDHHYSSPIHLGAADSAAAMAAVMNDKNDKIMKPASVASSGKADINIDQEDAAWEAKERKEQFKALSKDGGKSVAVSDFLAQELLAGLLEEGSLKRSTLESLLTKVKSSVTGRLSLAQFVQLSQLLDEVLEAEFQRIQKEERGKRSSSNKDDDEEEGEGEIEPAVMYKGWFDELSKDGGRTVTLTDFLSGRDVREMLAESGVSEETVKALAKKCRIDMSKAGGGRMNLDQFVQLNHLISEEEPNYKIGEEDLDDDDDDDDEYSDEDDSEDDNEEEEEEEEVVEGGGGGWINVGQAGPADAAALFKGSKTGSSTSTASSASTSEDDDLIQYDRELFAQLSKDGGKTVTLKSFMTCEDLQEYIEEGSLTARTIESLAKKVKPTAKETGLNFAQFVQLNQLISDHLDEVLGDVESSEGNTPNGKKEDPKAEQERIDEAVEEIEEIDRKVFQEHSQDGGKTVPAQQYIDHLQKVGVIDDVEAKLFMRQVKMDKNGGLSFEQFAQLNNLLSVYCGDPANIGEDDEEQEDDDDETDIEGGVGDIDWSEWEKVPPKPFTAKQRSTSSGTAKPTVKSSSVKSKPEPKSASSKKKKTSAVAGATSGGNKVNPSLFMKAGATPAVATKKKTKKAKRPVIGTIDPKDVDTFEVDEEEGDSLPDLANGIYESHEDAFDRLSEGGDHIRVSDFMQLPGLKGFISEGLIDVPYIELLIQKVGSSMGEEARLNFDQYCDLVEDIDDICGYDEGIQTQASQAEEDNSNSSNSEVEQEVVGKDAEEQEKIESYRELYNDLTTLSNSKKLSVRYLRTWSTVKDLVASGELTKDMLAEQLRLVNSDLSGSLTFSQFYRLATGLEQAMAEKNGKKLVVEEHPVKTAVKKGKTKAGPAAPASIEDDDSDSSGVEEALDKKVMEDQFKLLLDQAKKANDDKRRSSTLSVKDFKQWEDVRYMIYNKITSEAQINGLLTTVLGETAVTANKKMNLEQFNRIVAGLDMLQENHSSNGHEGFDTFDDHDPTPKGRAKDKKESTDKTGDKKRPDSEAELEDIFDTLRGSAMTVSIRQFLSCKTIAELLKYELVDEDTVRTLARELIAGDNSEEKAGKKVKKTSDLMQLTLPQFKDLSHMVQQAAKATGNDDDDGDGFEPAMYDVVPEDVAREMLMQDLVDPKEMAAREREMMMQVFTELTGGKGKLLDVSKFLSWEDVRSFVEDGLISEKLIREVISKVTKNSNAQKLTFQQFMDVYMVLEDRAEKAEDARAALKPRVNGEVEKVGQEKVAEAAAPGVKVVEVSPERRVFLSLKPDKEGRITLKQFRLWDGMQHFLAFGGIAEDQLKAIVKQVDKENEKKLTFDQFVAVLEAIQEVMKRRSEEVNENSHLRKDEARDETVTADSLSSGKLSPAATVPTGPTATTAASSVPSPPVIDKAGAVTANSATKGVPVTSPAIATTKTATNAPDAPPSYDRLQALYNRLKGPEEYLHISKFKTSSLVVDALKEGHLTMALIDEMIDAVTHGSRAYMKVEEFKQLTQLILKTAADLRKLNDGEELDDALEEVQQKIQVVHANKSTVKAATAALQKNNQHDFAAALAEQEEIAEEELSPEEQKRLDMEMFQSFYPDKITQQISIKQIRKWHVIEDCIDNDELSDPELQLILNYVDPEGTKRLDFKQFCALVRAVEAKIENNAEEVRQSLSEDEEDDGEEDNSTGEENDAPPPVPKKGFMLPTVKAAAPTISTTAVVTPVKIDMSEMKREIKGMAQLIRSERMPVHPESGRGFARPTMAEIRKEAKELQRSALKESKRVARLTRKAAAVNSTMEVLYPNAVKAPPVSKASTYAEQLYNSLKGLNPELPIGLFKSWDYIRTRVEKNILTDAQVNEILEKAGNPPGSLTVKLKPFSTAILVIYDVVKLFHETKKELKALEKEKLQESDVSEDDEFELPPGGRSTRKSRRAAKKRMNKGMFLPKDAEVLEEEMGPDKSENEVIMDIYNELKDPKTNILTVEKLFDWGEIRELIRSGALSHTNLRAAVDMCKFKDRIVDPNKFGDFLRAVDSFVDSGRVNPMNLHTRAAPVTAASQSASESEDADMSAPKSRRPSKRGEETTAASGANSIIHGIRYDFDNEYSDYAAVNDEEDVETIEQQYRRLCNGNQVLPEKDFRKHMKEYQTDGLLSKEQIEFVYQQADVVQNGKVTLDQFEKVMSLLDNLDGEEA